MRSLDEALELILLLLADVADSPGRDDTYLDIAPRTRQENDQPIMH
jgi:hypothetical protein